MATDFNGMAKARKDVENKFRKREEYLNITLNNIKSQVKCYSKKVYSLNKTGHDSLFGYDRHLHRGPFRFASGVLRKSALYLRAVISNLNAKC